MVDTLLKMYLAPTREKRYKGFIVKQKVKADKEKEEKEQHGYASSSTSYERTSVISKTRNGKRQLFHNERREQAHYLKKAENDVEIKQKWLTRAQRCEERIGTYTKVLRNEVR